MEPAQAKPTTIQNFNNDGGAGRAGCIPIGSPLCTIVEEKTSAVANRMGTPADFCIPKPRTTGEIVKGCSDKLAARSKELKDSITRLDLESEEMLSKEDLDQIARVKGKRQAELTQVEFLIGKLQSISRNYDMFKERTISLEQDYETPNTDAKAKAISEAIYYAENCVKVVQVDIDALESTMTGKGPWKVHHNIQVVGNRALHEMKVFRAKFLDREDHTVRYTVEDGTYESLQEKEGFIRNSYEMLENLRKQKSYLKQLPQLEFGVEGLIRQFAIEALGKKIRTARRVVIKEQGQRASDMSPIEASMKDLESMLPKQEAYYNQLLEEATSSAKEVSTMYTSACAARDDLVMQCAMDQMDQVISDYKARVDGEFQTVDANLERLRGYKDLSPPAELLERINMAIAKVEEFKRLVSEVRGAFEGDQTEYVEVEAAALPEQQGIDLADIDETLSGFKGMEEERAALDIELKEEFDKFKKGTGMTFQRLEDFIGREIQETEDRLQHLGFAIGELSDAVEEGNGEVVERLIKANEIEAKLKQEVECLKAKKIELFSLLDVK